MILRAHPALPTVAFDFMIAYMVFPLSLSVSFILSIDVGVTIFSTAFAANNSSISTKPPSYRLFPPV